MNELGSSFNVQCMLLLHQLKTTFQSVPDDVVRACMKKNGNQRDKCFEDLRRQTEHIYHNRYRSRQRLKLSHRRYSAGTLTGGGGGSAVVGGGEQFRLPNAADTAWKSQIRRNSMCATGGSAAGTRPWSGAAVGCSAGTRPLPATAATVLAAVDQNRTDVEMRVETAPQTKRVCESNSLPRKIMRCEVKQQDINNNNNNYNHSKINIYSNTDEVTTKLLRIHENKSPHEPKLKRKIPRPLSLAKISDLEAFPTVVLTPDSPPKDSIGNGRKIETLYSPDSGYMQEESTQVPEPSKPESLQHNQSKLESSEPESTKPESCQTFSSSRGVTLPTPQHLGVSLTSSDNPLGFTLSTPETQEFTFTSLEDQEDIETLADPNRRISTMAATARLGVTLSTPESLSVSLSSPGDLGFTLSTPETKEFILSSAESLGAEGATFSPSSLLMEFFPDNLAGIGSNKDISSPDSLALCGNNDTSSSYSPVICGNNIVSSPDSAVICGSSSSDSELICGTSFASSPDTLLICGESSSSSLDSLVICGSNTTVTNTCIDLLPGIGDLTLPFGNSSALGQLSPDCVITQNSVSASTLHFLKDKGGGQVAIATTTFCEFQKTVLTSSGSESCKPTSRSTSVLYTVNSKPVVCENPFRKVFAKRKQFYQAKERLENASPETSSTRLLWRPCNHVCRRGSVCPDNLPNTQPRYFTLNANIQPFDAFSIRHHLNREEGEETAGTSAVDLTLLPESCRPVKLLPDGQGLMYQSRVEGPEEGTQSQLEVKVGPDGSVITTKRTGSSDSTSNQISVQLLDNGNRVNIQQSKICQPLAESKPVRPNSLNIPGTVPNAPGSAYSTTRPQSLYQWRGTSPLSVPRYNSLPNLRGVTGEGVAGSYPSHPRDEQKRIAYTRALLSHQLEQLFKLESSLRAEKGEVDLLSHEVRDLEMKWNRKSIKTPAHQLEVEVDKLETDITNLRGECDIMSERVTDLTGGKVPLGETSVNFTDFLHKPAGDNTDGPPVAEPMETETPAPSDLVAGEGGKWNCSQCTFANHPQLDTCEICNMPKIKTGYESRSAQSPH